MSKISDLSKKKKIALFSTITALILVVVTVLSVFIGIYIEDGNKIKEISISATPLKTTYYVGETADYSGLKVQVIRNNKSSFMIEDIDLLTFEGFDSSVATSKKDIYVYFEGHFDTFSIEVINRPSVVSVLDYIYLNPHPKTEYKLNEPLNTVGGVIVKVYTDGKTDRLNLLNKH